MKHKRHRNTRGKRFGAAVVELAVCLPAIVLLILGSIEACTMVFVKQSLHIAAYEGVRRAIRYDSSEQSVLERCEQILDERDIHNASVEITPSSLDGVERGSEIAVRITAPARDNTIMRLQFFGGQLEAQATMVKE